MTPAEAAAVISNRGLEVWEIQGGMWAFGIRSQARVDGTFTVCQRFGLMAYARDLDPDSDYLPTLERTLTSWGQPAVSVRRGPWPGPGGGDVQTIDMKWKRAADEVTLSLSPEGRDGKGALRYNRGASISYVDRSRLCPAR
ncbi:hypothetical protein FQZ97_1146030 [compost metagenome]